MRSEKTVGRCTGTIYDVDDGLEEPSYPVTEAVVSKTRIVLDWNEDGQSFHAVLLSDDGYDYRGNYGTPIPEKNWTMEAWRFDGNRGDILLWASWTEEDGVGQGCIIHLAERWET